MRRSILFNFFNTNYEKIIVYTIILTRIGVATGNFFDFRITMVRSTMVIFNFGITMVRSTMVIFEFGITMVRSTMVIFDFGFTMVITMVMTMRKLMR